MRCLTLRTRSIVLSMKLQYGIWQTHVCSVHVTVDTPSQLLGCDVCGVYSMCVCVGGGGGGGGG